MVLMLIVRGRATGQQIGPPERRVPERREPARTRQQQAAGAVPPGAGEAGQQCDQPRRAAAAVHALHAVVQPDRRRLDRRQIPSQAAHLVGLDAAHRRSALGRPGQRARVQRRKAVDMALDVVVIEPIAGDQLMHHAERQRAIGAGQQGNVLMTFVCGFGAARIDAHQPGTGALGLLRQRPEVQVAGDRVAAPDHDQAALAEKAHVHAELGAVRRHQRVAAGGRADRAVQQRGAEPVEEARGHALALQQAHRAGVAVGHDRLGVSRGDRHQSRRDVGQRLVPAHADEFAAPLAPDALEWL